MIREPRLIILLALCLFLGARIAPAEDGYWDQSAVIKRKIRELENQKRDYFDHIDKRWKACYKAARDEEAVFEAEKASFEKYKKDQSWITLSEEYRTIAQRIIRENDQRFAAYPQQISARRQKCDQDYQEAVNQVEENKQAIDLRIGELNEKLK